MRSVASYALTFLAAASLAFPQDQPPPQTPAQRVSLHLEDINRKVLEMAKDFPAAKYNYKPSPEMRSFGDVIIHIASGNVFGSKAGRGEKVKWDEMDPKAFSGKDAIVAVFQKSVDDASAALKAFPEGPRQSLEPWLSIVEHSAEHYGLLVAYYRLNGMVPPESRPKK